MPDGGSWLVDDSRWLLSNASALDKQLRGSSTTSIWL